MHPLSFVIAFGVLGMFSLVGALMMVMSSKRLFKQLAGSPVLAGQHIMERRSGMKVLAAIDAFLLTVGIILLTLGVRGIYGVIWVP
ncbi:MAG: hypothetical protein HY532_08785 [Chloroflexi bacterium]|nr:hypothetical protein [Chloroflexota bacterium]